MATPPVDIADAATTAAVAVADAAACGNSILFHLLSSSGSGSSCINEEDDINECSILLLAPILLPIPPAVPCSTWLLFIAEFADDVVCN